ncbi:MAG: hypothetical protein DRI61_17400, partial [Chloroflexi bacterium]
EIYKKILEELRKGIPLDDIRKRYKKEIDEIAQSFGEKTPAITSLASTKPPKRYICPRHKGKVFDKPGRCPKCGRRLVEQIVYPVLKPPDPLQKILKTNILLFKVDRRFKDDLEQGIVGEELRKKFKENGCPISSKAKITQYTDKMWKIKEGDREYLVEQRGEELEIFTKPSIKGMKGFAEGYVFMEDPKTHQKQMTEELLIDRKSLSMLNGFLQAALMVIKIWGGTEKFLEMWKKTLKDQLGIEKIEEDEDIETCIRQRTGLPFHNGLMRYSLLELVKKLRDEDFKEKLLEKIEDKAEFLSDVLMSPDQWFIIPYPYIEDKYAWIYLEDFP